MMKRDSPMKTSSKDYYNLLGVHPDATLAQIKTAYRKLAKQYHPDVNQPSDAAERFREITEAYDTLTDPDRRRRYDRLHGTYARGTNTGAGNTGPKFTDPGAGPAPERLREQQRLPGSQPDPEGAGRHLAGNPPLAPGNTPGRHHHRQRHRRQANPARPPRPRPLERRRPAICRDHDQRRRTTPQPDARSSAPSCTKPPTPWPTHAASRTPPARAATTTSTSRPTPKSSA